MMTRQYVGRTKWYLCPQSTSNSVWDNRLTKSNCRASRNRKTNNNQDRNTPKRGARNNWTESILLSTIYWKSIDYHHPHTEGKPQEARIPPRPKLSISKNEGKAITKLRRQRMHIDKCRESRRKQGDVKLWSLWTMIQKPCFNTDKAILQEKVSKWCSPLGFNSTLEEWWLKAKPNFQLG